MMETELRQILVSRKEKYMKTESNITKLESDVDDLTKRIQHINLSLEKASITLKQVKKNFCSNDGKKSVNDMNDAKL
jgi:hypothetical protein